MTPRRAQRAAAPVPAEREAVTPARPADRVLLTLALMLLAALAVRAAGLGWSLPQVYEEAKPLRVAWGLWNFDAHAPFDGNPHFFRYPSLVIYLQYLGQLALRVVLTLSGQVRNEMDFRVLWATDKTGFLLVGRAISALFGTALVAATFALARRMAGTPAAWVAALIVALHPLFITRSQEVEVDLPLAFFVTLGLVACLRALERPSRANLVWLGVLTGLAASSKYTGVILLVPAGLALLFARSGVVAGSPATSPAPRASFTSALARLVTGGLLVAVVAGAVFALTSPYVLLDRAEFLRDLAAEREHMALGHFGAASGPSLAYYAGALAGDALGWPLLLLGLVALVSGALRRDARVLIPGGMVVLYLGVVGSWTMRAERYLLPMLPALVALGVTGAERVLGRFALGTRRVRAVAWGVLAVVAFAPLVLTPRFKDLTDRWRPDTRTVALRWFRANVPEGALVVVEEYAPELANYTLPELMGEVSAHLAESPRRPPFYAVQHLPMTQVDPGRSAPFYDLGLYRAADLVVVTSAVRSRYQGDPARFPRQCAFYDSLAKEFPVAARFAAEGRTGPEIVIYRNPAHEGWFASRETVPGPALTKGGPTGAENYFYWNLGVNYESAGFMGAAIACYRIALHFVPRETEAELYQSIATRLAYCLLATRPPNEALAALAEAHREAASPVEAGVIRWVGDAVASAPRQFATLGVPRFGTREAAAPAR